MIWVTWYRIWADIAGYCVMFSMYKYWYLPTKYGKPPPTFHEVRHSMAWKKDSSILSLILKCTYIPSCNLDSKCQEMSSAVYLGSPATGGIYELNGWHHYSIVKMAVDNFSVIIQNAQVEV